MSRLVAGLLGAALLGSAPLRAAEPNGVAVEYVDAAAGHYFISAIPIEIAFVDGGGAGSGWRRTGGQFSVWTGAGDAPGLQPVCRFYSAAAKSHRFTADAGECAALRSSPGWKYEGIAFYIATPQAGACADGTTPVYRAFNNGGAHADPNHRFTVDYTAWVSTPGFTPQAVAMCSPLSSADREFDALRLLRQATFGPTESEVARAAAMGPAAWVADQLAAPVTAYPEYPWVAANRPSTCVDDRTPPVRPDSYCARDNYTLFQLQLQFFRDALTQRDQLRGRVAFALSQILVTSGVDNPRNYAMRHYQQMLRDRAFGNFYDLLLAVTLSPVMGDYLDMANNNKANPATGVEPNENYAREILQLFSVGLWLLNPDGTLRLDAAGKPIATYDQEEIEGFAHVFTGWTYPAVPGASPRNNNPRNYLGNLVPVNAQHDFGEKVLLNGVTARASLGMHEDLAFAHQNIFTHPNVGPFVGKQLIQKLVTSHPSPGYVSRVSAIFDNNGAGQRGDLAAVVRAILLDPEARGARKIDPAYGKLSEPVLFMTHVARAVNARSDGVLLRAQSSPLGQFVFYSPSVFNFYPPDYSVPNTQLLGPEFGVQTSTTAVNRANFVNGLVFSSNIAPDASVYGATGTQIDLGPYQAVAANATTLIDRLDRNLLGGTMSAAMRNAIANAVNAVAATDTLNRARTAAYLVLTSPQYQVQR
jgi:uncharacterized protein (DUF1800 family)